MGKFKPDSIFSLPPQFSLQSERPLERLGGEKCEPTVVLDTRGCGNCKS